MTCSCSSGKGGASSEAASLAFRIATMGLSLASAITTATSTQCFYDAAGRPTGSISSGDYPSLRYAAAADLASAVLQAVAIFLEALGKKKAARVVELIDKLVLALTSTSAALLLAVDEITSCRRDAGDGRRRRQRVCGDGGAFCARVRVAAALSLAGTVSFSFSVYTRRAPAAAAVVREKLLSRPSQQATAPGNDRPRPPQGEPATDGKPWKEPPPTKPSTDDDKKPPPTEPGADDKPCQKPSGCDQLRPPTECCTDLKTPREPAPCYLPHPPAGYCADLAPEMELVVAQDSEPWDSCHVQ